MEDREGPRPVTFERLKEGLLLDWPAGCLGRWVCAPRQAQPTL